MAKITRQRGASNVREKRSSVPDRSDGEQANSVQPDPPSGLAPARPAKKAPASEWRAYATQVGLEDGLSKKQIIAATGG